MEIPVFEYMRFAKTASKGARVALTMSGIAAPPPGFLGDPEGLVDLSDTGSSGTLFLRERIANRYGVAPDEVMVTPGASAAIHIISAVLCSDHARAIVERPVYPPLVTEPRWFGAQIGYIERRAEEDFALSIDRAAASLALAPRAGIVFFTNTHNPTGALTPSPDIVALGEAAARTGTRLVCCELYGDFLATERPPLVATLVAGSVSIGSLTKAFGLGGLRVGWIICKDKAVLSRCEDYFDHLDVNCPMPTLKIAARAFDRMEWLEHRTAGIASAGRAVFLQWAAREQAARRIRVTIPPAGIIAFPMLSRVPDTMEFARRLRAGHGVQVTPGEYFHAPGHVRIGFGLDPELLKSGLAAISAELPAV